MKASLQFFLVTAVFTLPASAQAPIPKLSPRDIRVLPFAQEHKDTKFKSNTRELPSEFIVTTTDKIRFYGKRRTDGAPNVRGQPTGHLGQLALVPPGNRSGTLSLKKAFGLIHFFAVLELPDDTLDSKAIELKEGKNYTWSVKSENGLTTFLIVGADGAQIASNSAPADKVLGIGFAATARNRGNEIDMTITY
jgi:hypothetical protein